LGLSTLIATDRGDLMGRGFFDAMRRLDKDLTAIARHPMRAGGRPRESRRYRALVERVRGIIKTRINTALNRLVDKSPIAVAPSSRRSWRTERFGIATAEINPAYTSQECEPCGFVDRRNCKSQCEFRCLHCGHTAHADVNGAKVVAKRRSLGLDLRFTPRGQVLGVLRNRFAERHRPGTQASSGRPAGEIPRRGNEAFCVGVKRGAYHECQ
jgi:putative transposase